MVWSETIFVMIMSHEKFKTFMKKPIADSKNNIASWFALSVESLERLNEFMESGLNMGDIFHVHNQNS
jgi:predicted lactoylglutathione lyase